MTILFPNYREIAEYINNYEQRNVESFKIKHIYIHTRI